MNAFILKLLAAAIKDPDIRAFLLEVVDRMSASLVPNLAAVIPAAVAAGVKSLEDLMPDVNLPGLGDLTEGIRSGVNGLLPDGIDIPILSAAFEKVTGFDLSDILTGRTSKGTP